MKWYKNPLLLFTIGLLLFVLGALLYNFRPTVFVLLGSVFWGGGMGYLILKKWQPKSGHLPSNTLVSVLITFVLLNPALKIGVEPILWGVLAGLLVVLAKSGPTFKRQLIFNPAALGLLVLSGLLTLIYGSEALLPTFVSWWGTDYAGVYSLIILLPLIVYGALKFRKIYLVGAFLLFNAMYLFWQEGLEGLVYPYTTGMLYFLAGVMLLEPKTSPSQRPWQIGAAFMAFLTYRYIGSLGFNNVELWAIIAVNFVHLLSRLRLSNLWQKFKFKHV